MPDRRHWGPPWHEAGNWWEPAGRAAWTGFRRRMMWRFALFFVFVAIGLTIVGALLASFVFGISGASLPRILLVPAVVVGLAWLVARSGLRTWRPVRELIGAAGSLAEGDYSVRVPEDGSAALRSVARSFNRMAGRLESSDDQRRRLLADLGHELRTPLTVVRGEIEAMLDGVHAADPDHLEVLLDEVVVMERLIEDLRTLSLAEAGELALHRESVDLGDLLSDVADAYRRTAADQSVEVIVDGAGEAPEISVDPVRVREVVTNLVVNALRAMPDGGTLTLSLRTTQASLVVEVTDTGEGMPPDEVEGMFERFRKAETSRGSGLGLTISRDLVEAHGGTISLRSAIGEGTTASVRLPR